MGKPVARVSDMHTCPAVDGPKPHVGGPITGPGASTVLANNLPIAVVGDGATCSGPPDSLVIGCATVFAENKPIVCLGGTTAHGGVVVTGSPTVLAGAPAPPQQLQIATDSDRPLSEVCPETSDPSSDGCQG